MEGLIGCPEEQQEIPSVSGCGWAKERAIKTWNIQASQGRWSPTASGPARPRGRQRAAVGLRSLAGGQRRSRRFSLGVSGASITPRSGHAPFAPRGRLSGLLGTPGWRKEKSDWEGAGLGGDPELGRLSPPRPASR